MLIPTKQSQLEPSREQKEAEMQAQWNESEQETLLRREQAAAIYGIPEWEREEVRERVYSQYLQSYEELPPKLRGLTPHPYKRFLEELVGFDYRSLCARCKLCGTARGWGGHHGMLCGTWNKQMPREFGWYGGCNLYEPLEPEIVQLDLFGEEVQE